MHGYLLKDAKDTDEGKAYRKAYNAAWTVIQHHSAYAFGLEQPWFKSQDERIMQDIKVCTDSQISDSASNC